MSLDNCEQSARDVWGDALGDPTADAIFDAVREQGELTRTAVRDMFSRHRSGDYERALAELVTAGRLTVRTVETGGRPTSAYALPCDESDRSDKKAGRVTASVASVASVAGEDSA